MLPLGQPGWAIVTSLGTSCSANVSLTLICTLCHAAGKSAAALKTENGPNDPLIRPPLAWDEASVAPEIVRTCRVASYQGAPFSRLLTSNYLSISNRRPLRFDTAIDDRLLRPSEKGGVLTHRVEVSSVPDKSGFAGLYPEREVDARSGLGLGVRYR